MGLRFVEICCITDLISLGYLPFLLGSYRKCPLLTVLSLALSLAATIHCRVAKDMPLAPCPWSSSLRHENRLTGEFLIQTILRVADLSTMYSG